jgi:hypothetical protein
MDVRFLAARALGKINSFKKRALFKTIIPTKPTEITGFCPRLLRVKTLELLLSRYLKQIFEMKQETWHSYCKYFL